jgi:cysteine desulfurase
MGEKEKRIIYLDNHATTRCDPKVVEAMLPFFSDIYGNPSSSVHAYGNIAKKAIESARYDVANCLGAHSKEIIFTSGATESNNISVLGLSRTPLSKRKKIVISNIEHKSVLNTCKKLESEGLEIIKLPVNRYGRIEKDVAKKVIDERTLLVSVQAANNEIGTIQDIKHLSAISHNNGAYFHCDAAQAIGKIPVNVEDWDVDFLSLSGHKIYGPKGIGALYIRGGPYKHNLSPIIFGGGQEYNLRSGTSNVPGIVGLGVAIVLASKEIPVERKRSNMKMPTSNPAGV